MNAGVQCPCGRTTTTTNLCKLQVLVETTHCFINLSDEGIVEQGRVL